jgi:hypothetical protein
VLALVLILGLLAPSELKLVASADLSCPDADRVRTGLINLGVDLKSRDATADWSIEDGHIRLVVTRTASTGAILSATEREIPRTACDEIAEILALSIERATAPLGEAEDNPLSTRIEDERERGKPWGYGVHAGSLLLLSAKIQPLFEAGAEIWPRDGLLGGSLTLGMVPPADYTTGSPDHPRAFGLRVLRAFGALGAGLRFPLGDRVRLGGSASFIVEYVHGDPTVQGPLLRDYRYGWRGAGWLAVALGPVELRLEGALRGFSDQPTYQVIGASRTGDVLTLPFIDAELLLAVGLRSPSGAGDR